MTVLTLRNIPEDTLAWLRGAAARHASSVNAELLDLLEVARGDELSARAVDHPVAGTHRRARALGVRTSTTARKALRGDRERTPRR